MLKLQSRATHWGTALMCKQMLHIPHRLHIYSGILALPISSPGMYLPENESESKDDCCSIPSLVLFSGIQHGQDAENDEIARADSITDHCRSSVSVNRALKTEKCLT